MHIARPHYNLKLVIWLLALALAAAFILSPRVAGADVFVLRSGGRITGQLVNRDESPRTAYVVKTALGQVALDASEVREVVGRSAAQDEYERIRPTYPDTVDAQWALAEWCREHSLKDERTKHLERIIALDPDHAAARGLLGYSKFDGQWKTQSDVMTERGYVYYKGRWRLPQEIELIETERAQELAEKAWRATLKRLRTALDTERRQEALVQIGEITDPAAVPALIYALANEPIVGYRKMYVEALGRIRNYEATQALTLRALYDPSEEVRMTCLDYLIQEPHPKSVATFVQKLRDGDNVLINRAAVALGRIRQPSTMGPLVDALVTVHIKELPQLPGNTSAAFGPSGGTFSAGGSGKRTVTLSLQNPDVLDALVAMTGGTTFNYDKNAWRVWLANQKASAPVVDLRRDEPMAK